MHREGRLHSRRTVHMFANSLFLVFFCCRQKRVFHLNKKQSFGNACGFHVLLTIIGWDSFFYFTNKFIGQGKSAITECISNSLHVSIKRIFFMFFLFFLTPSMSSIGWKLQIEEEKKKIKLTLFNGCASIEHTHIRPWVRRATEKLQYKNYLRIHLENTHLFLRRWCFFFSLLFSFRFVFYFIISFAV